MDFLFRNIFNYNMLFTFEQLMQALAEMTEWVGNISASAYYSKLHVAWVKGFNDVFWNETLGYYMDWIDIKGMKIKVIFKDRVVAICTKHFLYIFSHQNNT